MSQHRYDQKPDENQALIVDEFRRLGAAVHIIKHPADLIVAFRGQTCVVEVKNPAMSPSDRRLTPAELRFWLSWYREGNFVVVESLENCRALINMIRISGVRGHCTNVMRDHFGAYSLQALSKIALEHGAAWKAAVQWMGGGNVNHIK